MKGRSFFFFKGLGRLILIIVAIALVITLLGLIGYWAMIWGISPIQAEYASAMPESYAGRVVITAFLGFASLFLCWVAFDLILTVCVKFYLGVLRLGGCPPHQMPPVFALKKLIKWS